MDSLQDVIRVIDQLSPDELQQLRAYIDERNNWAHGRIDAPKQRVFNLHPGAIQTSDNFDEPLPDEAPGQTSI